MELAQKFVGTVVRFHSTASSDLDGRNGKIVGIFSDVYLVQFLGNPGKMNPVVGFVPACLEVVA